MEALAGPIPRIECVGDGGGVSGGVGGDDSVWAAIKLGRLGRGAQTFAFLEVFVHLLERRLRRARQAGFLCWRRRPCGRGRRRAGSRRRLALCSSLLWSHALPCTGSLPFAAVLVKSLGQ